MTPDNDMRYSEAGEHDCFSMANMIPQNKQNNEIIWKKLENYVRDITNKYDTVIVITGAVIKELTIVNTQKGKLIVPKQIYKIVYIKNAEAISFVMNNQGYNEPLIDFIHNIRYVETLTGISFFNNTPNKNEFDNVLDKEFWFK